MNIKSYQLASKIKGGEGIAFLRADMPKDTPSSFALIRISDCGVVPKYGYRLDLGKQVILDHHENSKKDRVIHAATKDIVALIVRLIAEEKRAEARPRRSRLTDNFRQSKMLKLIQLREKRRAVRRLGRQKAKTAG